MKKKLNFYPEDSSGNDYVENTKIILSKICDVEHKNPIKFLKFKYFDVSVVNWLENCIVKNKKIYLLGIIKFIIKFLLYKATSKKIIYVRHNYYPHNIERKFDSIAAKVVIDFVSKFSDDLICHSPASGLKNHKYIPHPPYVFELLNTKKHDCWVIFGRIEPYKNIDKIIEIWSGDEKLIIVGNGGDISYINKIKKMAAGKNISINQFGLSDEDSIDLISGCNGVIINNSDSSCIVSGAYVYAKSIGAKILANKSNFIESETKEYDNLFMFDHVNDINNILELCKKKPAKDMLCENKEIIKKIERDLWKIIY